MYNSKLQSGGSRARSNTRRPSTPDTVNDSTKQASRPRRYMRGSFLTRWEGKRVKVVWTSCVASALGPRKAILALLPDDLAEAGYSASGFVVLVQNRRSRAECDALARSEFRQFRKQAAELLRRAVTK